MTAQSFLKEYIDLPQTVGASEEAELYRNNLALRATAIKAITDAASQTVAAVVAVDIRTYVKETRESGLALRRPINRLIDRIKEVEDDHLTPLVALQEQIESMATNFQEAEERRVDEEQQKREAEFRNLEQERIEAEMLAKKIAATMQTEEQLAEALAKESDARAKAEAVQAKLREPLPERQKASGMSFRRLPRWEVTNLQELAKARPDLVRMEPNAAGILATCNPNMPNMPPGLKMWWEKETVTRSR